MAANTDGRSSVHDHSIEIERSRPQTGASSRPRTGNRSCGSAGSQRSQSALGPVRSRRESVHLSRPTSGVSNNSDLQKHDPLPPIGHDNDPSDADYNSDHNTLDSINSSSIDNRQTPGGSRYPRVLGFRRELSVQDEQNQPSDSKMSQRATSNPRIDGRYSQRAVSFSAEGRSGSISQGEMRRLKCYDGREITMVSVDCQTDFAYDPQISTPGKRSTRLRLDEEEDEDIFKDEEDLKQSTGRTKSRKSEKPVSQLSKRSSINAMNVADISGGAVSQPFTDDTYGIPILDISTDSDSDFSDEDDHGMMQRKPGTDANYGMESNMLPSIGPPQILQYNRESQQADTEEGHMSDSELPDGNGANMAGLFEGECEFCGEPIKSFPSPDNQTGKSPEELYCCKDYKDFVQFMITHPLHEQYNADKLIDIAPHPPHGSKQARRAAKERAAQRMRERELARQQAAATGGGGGGGGPSNFYQLDPDYSIPTHMLPAPAVQPKVARQMKTINFQLSSQKCLDEGWTLRPPSPLLENEQEIEVFEPQPLLPPWAESQKTYRNQGLIQKFYDDGTKFLTMFADGTGNVFYPSGRLAIGITSLESGLHTYIVLEDKLDNPSILAVFEPDGHATSYYTHGMIRVCLDQIGGIELDNQGFRKRKWSWKEQIEHVHAPPIQPITFAITSMLAVRIMAQENITLTMKAKNRSCRFQVGAKLKLVAPENLPAPEIDEDKLYMEESVAKIQLLFTKVSNLLKFPKSPKLDKLPNPLHLTNRISKIDQLRGSLTETRLKEKPRKSPVVVVN